MPGVIGRNDRFHRERMLVKFPGCFKELFLFRRVPLIIQKWNPVVDYIDQIFAIVFNSGQPFVSNDRLLYFFSK